VTEEAKVEDVPPWAPLGAALEACHDGRRDALLEIESDFFETEEVAVTEYYRPLDMALPGLEQEALRRCRGRVLDLGAGAGRHSLELQQAGMQPVAVDISPKAVEVMKARGVGEAYCLDFRQGLPGEFDTILMMMNGIGLAGSVEELESFLVLLRAHLRPGGRILCDASSLEVALPDLQPEIMEDDAWAKADLGEVFFRLRFGELQGGWYPWLFPAPSLLEHSAAGAGLRMGILSRAGRGAYLAILEYAE